MYDFNTTTSHLPLNLGAVAVGQRGQPTVKVELRARPCRRREEHRR